MLEARPDLTWRDVQGILAVTSEKMPDPDDSSAHQNSAGFWHSHWYGFGIIDAKKAVDTAITWELWPPEQQVVGESARENQPFPDISETEYVSELTINHKYKTGFISESVVVSLNLKHYNHGRLKLTLVSPSGTESILNDGNSSEHGILGGSEKSELMTLRSWGEDPTGVWQLKVRDFSSKGVILSNENVFLDWVLVVYGRVRRPKVSCWQVPSYAKRYSPDCGGASWDELVKTCQEADLCDCIPSEYKRFNPDCLNSSPSKARPTLEEVVTYLSNGVSDESVLRRSGSPQNKAARWLATEDGAAISLPKQGFERRRELHQHTDNSDAYMYVFRYVMAVNYFALDGPNWLFDMNFLTDNPICEWNQVSFGNTDTGRVYEIGGVTCDPDTNLPIAVDLGEFFGKHSCLRMFLVRAKDSTYSHHHLFCFVSLQNLITCREKFRRKTGCLDPSSFLIWSTILLRGGYRKSYALFTALRFYCFKTLILEVKYLPALTIWKTWKFYDSTTTISVAKFLPKYAILLILNT